MSTGGRSYDRGGRRDGLQERDGYNREDFDRGRPGHQESECGRSREREWRDTRDDADYQRRPPPLCYGCNVPGHYRSDCWRFWRNADSRRKAERDGFTCPPNFDKRGRSGSPTRSHRASFRRSPSLDFKMMSKIAKLGDIVITLKEFVDVEKSRKLEKERKR
ncbi:hypothetical protein CBR_g41157 [Chara braunii]|uniref:CCHC-type domain-containing protein n=1 Tax=Chara braunii TaxID=69332 RepID=A0A388K2G7_CHABU|nr:hypothetical protein CBR_g41157 [Chara braunii]|eukprot:GBG64236.1 hypothetical protein CBR_g41157 [Chara braunii]